MGETRAESCRWIRMQIVSPFYPKCAISQNMKSQGRSVLQHNAKQDLTLISKKKIFYSYNLDVFCDKGMAIPQIKFGFFLAFKQSVWPFWPLFKNLKIFLNAVKECNLTLNESKCVYASETINLLGYRISKGVLHPDPDCVKPVLDMPVPCNAKGLQRMLGVFSYYAKWIPHYSEKIKPLVVLKKFPLNDEALHALTTLKTDLSSAKLGVIDEDLPFTLETDASDNAISATLN